MRGKGEYSRPATQGGRISKSVRTLAEHVGFVNRLDRDDFRRTQSAHGEEGLSLSKTRLEPPTVLRDEPSTSSVSPQDERVDLKSSCSSGLGTPAKRSEIICHVTVSRSCQLIDCRTHHGNSQGIEWECPRPLRLSLTKPQCEFPNKASSSSA
jgi:hypothetical protein